MRFRDPKTGKVFEGIYEILNLFCTEILSCGVCPFSAKDRFGFCHRWVRENPTEAARLMGYEVIEDEAYDSPKTCGICEHSKPFGIYGMVKCSKTDRYLPCEHKCDIKEDNMEKNKPLREWTLKEVQELCDNQDDCPGCPCYTAENGCMFSGEATSWPLSETEAMSAISATDTNVACKPAKSRLAEVLGVEVGERFKVCDADGGWDGDAIFYINEYGKFVSGKDPGSSVALCCAIQCPESIVRATRLTEEERTICKATGAKWVSMDKHGDSQVNFVRLWDEKPKELKKVNGWIFEPSVGDHSLAFVYTSLFPSVKPGDCICVEEAGGDEY